MFVKMLVGPQAGLTVEIEGDAGANLIKRGHAEPSTQDAYEADAMLDQLVSVRASDGPDENKALMDAPRNKTEKKRGRR